ncbi:MAG: hypothetical protein IKD16_06165 [Bacteroidales bacterium]|nr:hypothetical protein [Bacteroidales bacterium]
MPLEDEVSVMLAQIGTERRKPNSGLVTYILDGQSGSGIQGYTLPVLDL